MTKRTLPYSAAKIEGTPFFIFALGDIYQPQHTEALDAIAKSRGAGFVACEGGGAFVAHRDVIGSHPDYVGDLLTEASNHGLLPG